MNPLGFFCSIHDDSSSSINRCLCCIEHLEDYKVTFSMIADLIIIILFQVVLEIALLFKEAFKVYCSHRYTGIIRHLYRVIAAYIQFCSNIDRGTVTCAEIRKIFVCVCV